MIHDPFRTPYRYSRFVSRRSQSTHQIMRGYATFLPNSSGPYLSQVVIIPPDEVEEALAETRGKLQPQIDKYGFPVRFFTPDETLRIAGILPQRGPPGLVWELAGNACSPFLLFEALTLVEAPEIQLHFPVRDLRRAWCRKLNYI